MVQSAIDFRELRRRERQRIRSSKQQTDDGDAVSHTSAVKDCPNLLPKDQLPVSPSCTSSEGGSLDPYKSLLPSNQLSKETHRIGCPKAIDSVFYAQNFLSAEQANEVTSWLKTIPEYSQHGIRKDVRLSEREESIQHNGQWTHLKHARRKVALFDGSICNLPPTLQRVSNTLVAVGAFPSSHPPNHVLVNEYQPGEGIMPHTDGPAYESCTATISLGGSDVIFKLWPRHNEQLDYSPQFTESREKKPSLEVILHGRGSLVVFKNDAYLNHCHEISEDVLEEMTSSNGICGNDLNGGTLVKRGYRISLTFRHRK